MPPVPVIPQRQIQTLSYKTYVKRIIGQALRDAFHNHPDPTVAGTHIGLDFETTKENYPPIIIIKFYERDINNIGVGHFEYLPYPLNAQPPQQYLKYYHRLYHGDIEFQINALRPLDRDTIADALIEVLGMGDTTTGGQAIWNRLYQDGDAAYYSPWHYVVLNTNVINGFGEMQTIAPWLPEDTLVFQTSYRVPILGEFYSVTPQTQAGTALMLNKVLLYPWDDQDPLDIPPANFPGGIVPTQNYLPIVAEPTGQVDI